MHPIRICAGIDDVYQDRAAETPVLATAADRVLVSIEAIRLRSSLIRVSGSGGSQATAACSWFPASVFNTGFYHAVGQKFALLIRWIVGNQQGVAVVTHSVISHVDLAVQLRS